MRNFNVITNLLTSQIKKNLLLTITILASIFSVNIPVKTQNVTDQKNKIEEQLQIINSTLASFPAQGTSKYTEISRISINSKGKLMLYKQYQVAASCTASREEVFLADLEPTNISSFTKGNTMVITVGCKNNLGNCVQRFFRNSCDVTFKPESFQKELLIISSANLRNTEQLRNAFSQLIKIVNNYQNPSDLENKEGNQNNLSRDSVATNLPAQPTSPALKLINPTPEEKKKRVSLTMDDVTPAQREKKKKPKQATKTTPNAPQLEKPVSETDESLDLDKLLDLLLENK
ncbi:MAG: hypothetical protein FD167_2484 [bacterium]|nr:MAG: hypothetical protein FD167_2484 [bacterium]